MKNRKWLWFAIIAVVILGVGFFWIKNSGNDKITYRLDKVDRGDVVLSISATGTLNADTTVQVGSQVSGRISKIYVDFNSVVKKGQLLAQLDPTFLQATLDQGKAGLFRAQATMNQATRDFNRSKDLFAKDLISQADMDAAVTNFESAKAGVEQAKAVLEGAQVNLRYATITSPIGGVVISRNVDVGQTVAASLQAPVLFAIANNLKKMQVQASVDEADIGSVKVGQKVSFHVDAFPDNTFEGIVSQLRLSPVITQNVVNYVVVIDVANPDLKLMPGMTATVSIVVDKRENVLRVPIQAVRFTPPEEAQESTGGDTTRLRGNGNGNGNGGGRQPGDSSNSRGLGKNVGGNSKRARIWVLENGKPKPVPIVKGLMNTQYVEVVDSRLKEGDQVIIGALGGTQTVSTTQNPLQPRIGGGGGGRRGF